MTLRRFFIVLFLICCLMLAAIFSWKRSLNTPLSISEQIILDVPPGSSIFSIAHTLKTRGIISNPKSIILLTQLLGYVHHLKAGEYQLTPGMTSKQLLTMIVNGKVFLRQYTIVEGRTFKQVLGSINSNLYLTHTINKLTPVDIAKRIGTLQQNFEGCLYPDTYRFAAGIHDLIILKKAFWNMQHTLDSLWQHRATNLPYDNTYKALIVASLIEKETARPEERRKIAGVILRRLQKKMRLQIDASVIYGLGQTYTGKLTKNDLSKDTPYNTYLHIGLPPTPIAMPSLPSIVAALHPEIGTALYYVAKGDGTHQFTDTLQDHHDAIKRYHVKYLEQFEVLTNFHNLTTWLKFPKSLLHIYPNVCPLK